MYFLTCLMAQQLPFLLRCGRKIYVINLPAAWWHLPSTFAGTHLTFVCLCRHVDYFRCVQALRFFSMLACT